MTKRTVSKTPRSEQNRTVYEVLTSLGGSHRVEAGSTAELRDELGRLLPELEPYAVQAAARLASIERATVTAVGWSVRRVGVMRFQPDEPVRKEVNSGVRPPRKPAAQHEGQTVGPTAIPPEMAAQASETQGGTSGPT